MAVNEDDPIDEPQKADGGAPDAPLRVSDIKERLGPDAPYGKLPPEETLRADLDRLDRQVPPNPGRWDKAAQQTAMLSRLMAIAFFACFLVGLPLGATLATMETTGILQLRLGYQLPDFVYMITIPLLVYVLGRIAAVTLRMAGKAEQLEASAARLVQPETAAVDGMRTVGNAVSAQINTLNTHLDEALAKLAGVESMIRQQVKAIDSAASAMEDGSTDSVQAVASEREKLITLTEKLNVQADAFAEAIAEKAKLANEQSNAAHARIAGAEAELENRLTRLEETAGRALHAFEALSKIMVERQHAVTETSTNLSAATTDATNKSLEASRLLAENTQVITQAQTHLAKESERLEELIQDQKERAERLAATISAQTRKLGEISMAEPPAPAHSAPPASPNVPHPEESLPLNLSPGTGHQPPQQRENRQSKSWKDILAAADEAGEPLTLGADKQPPTPASQSGDVYAQVRDMQDFMHMMMQQLYGAPQPAVLVRFDGGERNIFANLLLAEDADDLKQRIKLEAARDERFQKGVYGFLESFDHLLEPATDDANSESLIDDYLGSPLGRMYLLIGSAVDYFS